MTEIERLSPPAHPGVSLRVTAPDTLELSGKITSRDPSAELGPFFRRTHEAAKADGLTTFNVDVSGLEFVNSSSIRLFVDWATWLKSESTPSYVLRFLTNRTTTWQRTSFVALKALAKEVVMVEAKS